MKKLKLYRIEMTDMFGERRFLNYVTHSEKAAQERWEREYKNSSWHLDKIVYIDKIDGHHMSFEQ